MNASLWSEGINVAFILTMQAEQMMYAYPREVRIEID